MSAAGACHAARAKWRRQEGPGAEQRAGLGAPSRPLRGGGRRGQPGARCSGGPPARARAARRSPAVGAESAAIQAGHEAERAVRLL